MTTATITPRDAEWRLSRLRRCELITPYRAGDDELICANDGFALVVFGKVTRHDPDEIKAMVDAAAPLYWPAFRDDEDPPPPRMPRR